MIDEILPPKPEEHELLTKAQMDEVVRVANKGAKIFKWWFIFVGVSALVSIVGFVWVVIHFLAKVW